MGTLNQVLAKLEQDNQDSNIHMDQVTYRELSSRQSQNAVHSGNLKQVAVYKCIHIFPFFHPLSGQSSCINQSINF